MNDTRQLVIGLGTGRCGTVSLMKILNAQPGLNFSHESRPVLPWKFSEKKIDEKMKQIMSYDGTIVGDIAFFYLPYVEYILGKNPSTKFVCLQRPKNEVVKSYLQKTYFNNPWIIHDGKKWLHYEWDDCYPKYNVKSKSRAIGLYWDHYHREIHRLMELYPKNISLYDMTLYLNESDRIRELLHFVGVKMEDAQILTVKTNVAKQLSPFEKFDWWFQLFSKKIMQIFSKLKRNKP
ncbi:hypothetical protein ACFL2O_07645 [Thermodesulfobacteriota bacterium]